MKANNNNGGNTTGVQMKNKSSINSNTEPGEGTSIKINSKSSVAVITDCAGNDEDIVMVNHSNYGTNNESTFFGQWMNMHVKTNTDYSGANSDGEGEVSDGFESSNNYKFAVNASWVVNWFLLGMFLNAIPVLF
jgi:hypothetical protein